MYARHPIPVGAQRLRQPLQPPRDGGDISGQIVQPRDPRGGHEPLGQQAIQLRSDVGDGIRLRGRGLVGQRHLYLVRAGQHFLYPIHSGLRGGT